jgi:hypothetical protein
MALFMLAVALVVVAQTPAELFQVVMVVVVMAD